MWHGIHMTCNSKTYNNKITKPGRKQMEIYGLKFLYFMYSDVLSNEDRL